MKSYLLVADVLGFKEIVGNLPHPVLSDRIKGWVALVEKTKQETGIEKVQLVSDTVFAQEPESKGPDRLLQFSKVLLERSIEESLPVRGAITHGEVSWEGGVAYGGAVVEAYQLEQSLEWIGIACGQLSAAVPWSWDLVCVYPIPKKMDEIIILSGAIVWDTPKPKDFLKHCIAPLQAGDHLKWRHISKLINALIFSKYTQRAKQAKLKPDKFNTEVPSHFNFE